MRVLVADERSLCGVPCVCMQTCARFQGKAKDVQQPLQFVCIDRAVCNTWAAVLQTNHHDPSLKSLAITV